ncbi:MAG: hypothetical protein IJ156_02520 [Bacteroidales bacterium]|nr:hypothetical protein [Bacteroidales bacterium]
MKNLDEITRLGADDLDRISLDESIPVPEELATRIGSVTKPRTRRILWSIPAAAALAALVAVGIGLTRKPALEDTFDDPYLAYAEVEKVFSKISGTVAYGADKVSDTESRIDKISYWK